MRSSKYGKLKKTTTDFLLTNIIKKLWEGYISIPFKVCMKEIYFFFLSFPDFDILGRRLLKTPFKAAENWKDPKRQSPQKMQKGLNIL